jgi:hypothetical protein
MTVIFTESAFWGFYQSGYRFSFVLMNVSVTIISVMKQILFTFVKKKSRIYIEPLFIQIILLTGD